MGGGVGWWAVTSRLASRWVHFSPHVVNLEGRGESVPVGDNLQSEPGLEGAAAGGGLWLCGAQRDADERSSTSMCRFSRGRGLSSVFWINAPGPVLVRTMRTVPRGASADEPSSELGSFFNG